MSPFFLAATWFGIGTVAGNLPPQPPWPDRDGSGALVGAARPDRHSRVPVLVSPAGQ